MANAVFLLDTKRKPLDPIHPGYARRLLNAGKAAVIRRYPFTIILKRPVETDTAPLRIKIDPGSRKTGMAIVDDQAGKDRPGFSKGGKGKGGKGGKGDVAPPGGVPGQSGPGPGPGGGPGKK